MFTKLFKCMFSCPFWLCLRVGVMSENLSCSCSCLYHAGTCLVWHAYVCLFSCSCGCSFIHSIHYLGSSVVRLLSMAQRIFSYVFYLLPLPLPYPTLAPSYFIFLFACLSCELLCYTRSVTQIPVFVVENDTSITFVFFPKFMKCLFTTINDLSTEWV